MSGYKKFSELRDDLAAKVGESRLVEAEREARENLTIELTADQAKQFIRLVLVAECEGRASGNDWDLAKKVAGHFGWLTPTVEPDRDYYGNNEAPSTWDFYWPDD